MRPDGTSATRVGDGGAVLDADDGEGVGVEGVLAGVLGGAGFAFLRSRGPVDLRALAWLAATRLGEDAIGQALACGWGAGMGLGL